MPVDLLAAFYAGVTAIEEGKIAEIEAEQVIHYPDDREERILLTARRDVKHIHLGTSPPDGT